MQSATRAWQSLRSNKSTEKSLNASRTSNKQLDLKSTIPLISYISLSPASSPVSALPSSLGYNNMTGSNKISIETLTNTNNSFNNQSATPNVINRNNNNNITTTTNNNNNNNNIHSNYAITTNKLMMKLLPWCKLKRKQFVFRDSLSCDDISSVMINRRPQSTSGCTDKITSTSTNISSASSASTMAARLFSGKRVKSISNGLGLTHNNSSTGKRQTSSGLRNSTSAYPMVSFVNKGEGLVTVDSTFDRILMSNENELYSLGSTQHQQNNCPSQVTTSAAIVSSSSSSSSSSCNFSSSFHSLSNVSSSLSSSKSMGNILSCGSTGSYGLSSGINTGDSSLSDCDITQCYGGNELPAWFYGTICRDRAIAILARQPIGSFLVRESISKPGCYALSLRVPKRFQVTGVAHYLIFRTSQGTYKIKGFTKEFSSLHSLIIHHSIMQELLPCPLNLAAIKQQRSQTMINLTEAQTQLIEDPTTIIKTVATTIPPTNGSSTLPQQTTLNGLTTITNYDNNEDLLVDIDSDPDYQRILSQFRKTMATCR